MTKQWTIAHSTLVRYPESYYMLERADARNLLMVTGGSLVAGGTVRYIKVKHLGAGAYRVTLEPKGSK